MAGWAYYRIANGRLPYFPTVAEAVGDATLAAFLAVNADLAAGAAGPFQRHLRTGSPLWSDAFPASRSTLSGLLELVYDAGSENPVSPLERIQHNAHRDGPHRAVHHFHHPEILKAYTEMAYPSGSSSEAVSPGNLWWTGPVDSLKAQLLATLRPAGLLGDFPDSRVYECLELVLEEQLRECHAGNVAVYPDMTESLLSFVSRRYSPGGVPGCKYDLLRYDAFWASMRRIVGLQVLRPSFKSETNKAQKVAAATNRLLEKMKELGMNDEHYLRKVHHWCQYTKSPPSIKLVLEPAQTMLM